MNKIIILIVALTLSACALTPISTQLNSPLAPVSSEYLTTLFGGFLLNSGKPMYAMTYKIIKPLPSDITLRVLFENPEENNTPFVTQVVPKEDEILVQSKPMEVIENKRNYKVIVELVKDNQVISTHVQHIRFDVPDEVLLQMGVTTI